MSGRASVEIRNVSTGKTGRVSSNSFGDFKADGLDRGDYVLNIEYQGYRFESIPVRMEEESVYLGTIEISQIKEPDNVK
jgi:hypothetical protein